MVLSLSVKQGVWDESIYGGSLVKGIVSVREWEVLRKKDEVEKSWWGLTFGRE